VLEALAPVAHIRQANATAIPATTAARMLRGSLMKGGGIQKLLYSSTVAGGHSGSFGARTGRITFDAENHLEVVG
jgi:hypothetical protein